MLDEAAPAPTPVTIDEFWSALEEATDPGATRPRRSDSVQVARLEAAGEPYYVLKQPETHAYLRLSEEDYVLWWQMDGEKRIKDLLFYSLVRFRALPIGRLNRLVADLRAASFLT